MQVWEAIQELKAGAAWKVDSIMEFATAFEAQLATGQSHDLPSLQAPKQPPVDSSLSASEVLAPRSRHCLTAVHEQTSTFHSMLTSFLPAWPHLWQRDRA